jgi:hypothetical protein
MLPLLEKYEKRAPRILERWYAESMLKDSSSKAETFASAINAIKRGLKGTWDAPEG